MDLITFPMYGSSITTTPFFDRDKLIASKVSFKFGICEIVFAEKKRSMDL